MRVFSIFCTYISERVFITVPDKPERGFKRNVRYRKAGRTRQAAGAGKHPSEAAAITALCFRLRIRENQKKDGTDKPDPQEQEEKSQ